MLLQFNFKNFKSFKDDTILDLSAINTNVTLPTDMTSNPNPGTISEGVLGPATLDVNDQAA